MDRNGRLLYLYRGSYLPHPDALLQIAEGEESACR
jgi:hypothetical protein